MATIARVTEVIASSNNSFDDAVSSGITRANKTLKNVSGAWVKDQSVKVEKGKIVQYRVTMKITFILTN